MEQHGQVNQDDTNDDHMICLTEIEDGVMEEHHNDPSDNGSVNFYAHMIKKIELIKFNSIN